jgi:hypothetical protein
MPQLTTACAHQSKATRLQEAAGHGDDDAHRRHTSDEVELMVTRSAASTPNFFADGLPIEPEIEPLASPTALPEADGFQLVPATAHPGLPPSFGIEAVSPLLITRVHVLCHGSAVVEHPIANRKVAGSIPATCCPAVHPARGFRVRDLWQISQSE